MMNLSRRESLAGEQDTHVRFAHMQAHSCPVYPSNTDLCSTPLPKSRVYKLYLPRALTTVWGIPTVLEPPSVHLSSVPIFSTQQVESEISDLSSYKTQSRQFRISRKVKRFSMGGPTHSCTPGPVLLLFQNPEAWFAFPLQLEICKRPFPAEWPAARTMALLQGAHKTTHALRPTSHLAKLWWPPCEGCLLWRGVRKSKRKKRNSGCA